MPQQSSKPSVPSDRETSGSKRRRIALACNVCRTRKSRCDGQRPTCSACSQLSFECQYDAPDSSKHVIVQKEYVSDVEQRLKQVERMLQRHDDLLTGHLTSCRRSNEVRRDPRSKGVRPSSTPESEPAEGDVHLEGDSAGEEDNEARTDGLAITFVGERSSAYFGESSNIHLLRWLLSAMAVIWNIKRPEQPAGATSHVFTHDQLVYVPGEYSPMATETSQSSDSSMTALPPAAKIEDLMRVYFHTMGLLFPFLHEPTFRDTYDRFKRSEFRTVRRTWLGVLNMIMAMATNIGRGGGLSAKQRLETSLVFYRRAVALCNPPSIRTVSLDIVHYLLLQVLYLQGTPRSIQAWSIHGLLVRTATSLGLHSDQAGQHLPPIEREVRRRTWHTIYCLDQVLSATFGRPCAILESQLTVPLPSPWTGSNDGNRIPREDNDMMQYTTEYLAATSRLYQIMGQSLAQQYNGNFGEQYHDYDDLAVIQTVGEMRQKLRQWIIDLPSFLHILQPDMSTVLLNSSLLHRLRTTMTLSYHNLNILVHRPLIGVTLRYLSQRNTSLDTQPSHTVQLAMAEAEQCVDSAESIIDIISTILSANATDGNNLGVWFFTLYYVITASLVVCARLLWAQHSNGKDAEHIISSGRSCLKKAAAALDRLDDDNHLVSQCSQYIRYLSELRDSRPTTIGADASGQLPSANEQFARGSDIGGSLSPGLQVSDDFFSSIGNLQPFLTTEMFEASMFEASLPFGGG